MTGKIEKFKKCLAILLIVFLMLYQSVIPAVVFADETPPDPQPTVTEETPTSETSATTETNDGTVENDVQTTSDTGDNTINPTPVPEENTDSTDDSTQDATDEQSPTEQSTTEEVSPTPDPTPQEEQATESAELESTDNQTENSNSNNNDNSNSNSISLANEGDVENDINSDSNTGENKIATPSATPLVDDNNNSCPVENAGGGEIDSGDALSETVVDNSVNTNSVNSQVVYQTINIFVDESGNLNLSDPFQVASQMIQQHPDDEIINVSFTNLQNYAFVSNNVVSYANTGGNTINGGVSGVEAIINSGDAYSIVSLLNKVNFTVVNSVIHIVSINVFGKLNGNIILPDFTPASCSDCGMSLVATNSATVVNNVDSAANSGENTINGNGSIVSGDAASIVNNLNLINANFVNTSIYGLFINLLGNWIGNFIGWNGLAAQLGGSSLMFFSLGGFLPAGSGGCSTCVGDLSIYNSAYVENNVTSLANSGSNTINGNGNINTGNAFSAVSLINFVNANFINSVGFFGFLNIFGDWTGDIGGKAEFDALNKESEEEQTTEQLTSKNDGENNEGDQKQEEGGLLSVEQANNVGEYVYPGDTVTFFVKIKNFGTGKVYGTKLKLFLVKDGVNMGGGLFEIGDIPGGRSVKLSTGLVLSKNALPGEYFAVALAEGNVGPDGHMVSGQAQSNFKIFGKTTLATLSTNTQNPPEVLGSKNFDKVTAGQTREQMLFLLLVAVIAAYSSLRVIRKRQYIAELFASGVPFKIRLNTLRMFLL
ncbi:MAG: hypothetical protein HY344_02170 [Candidatus Levybacteria bacterium]|nr:hypothetical protein [Candidatus Levybacteria bacterium]